MPLEHTSWIVPAIKEGYDHRKDILSAWEKIAATLLGKQSVVVMTGMPGVGKSVLLEYMTGEAYQRGRPLPLQPSPAMEEGKLLGHKKRIRLATIPGQELDARYKAAQKLFQGKTAVSGVIHVAASGFAALRSKPARSALQARGVSTVDLYRKYMLREEIEDLKRTCNLVKYSFMRHRQPMWMLLVVNKCDLFASEIGIQENYYSPFGDNEFVLELGKLRTDLGELNFSWDAMPACAALEPMEWNGTVVIPQLVPSQRDQLITDLLRRVDANCAG